MKLIGINLKTALSAVLLLLSMTLLSQNAFAQASNVGDVEGVCLYSKTKFRGNEFCATTDISFIPLRFRTRSIRVAKGYEVTLYRFPFFIGASSKQQKDNANFTELSAGKARSLKLTKLTGPSNNVAAIVPVLSLLLLDGDVDPNDYDGDGFTNDVEDDYGTDPRDPNSTPPDIDGDKIPDDVDDDRDGDGFTNVVETDNNTDPNNPNDYPDLVAPELIVDNASNQNLTSEQIIVTGTVNDAVQPRSGLAEFYIQSDVYGDTKFTGARDETTGKFSIEVPLKLGVNKLVVLARDKVGNESLVGLTIARGITPVIVNIVPASGTVSTSDTIALSGRINTNLPIDQFTLVVNDSRVVTTSTNQADLYDFIFANVPLEIGENKFVFELSSDFGGDTQTIIINYLPDAADTLPRPRITGVNPSNGATLNQTSFRVGAQVQSFAGPLSVSVNGSEVLSATQGLTVYSVNELVSFAANQEQLSTLIEARDSLGKTTNLTVVHFQDVSGPTIQIDQSFGSRPQVNTVTSSPVVLSGRVTDSNLASVLVNDQSVTLTPADLPNTYTFNVKVAVDGDQAVPVNITAYDRSGNKTVKEYLIKNTATSSITSILPPADTSYISNDEPISVQVAARLFGQNDTDQAYVYIESAGRSSAQLLSIVDTLASGSVQLPAESSDQTIVYELRDQSGATITQDTTKVSVNAAADVAFEVVRVEPANNSEFIEPNAPIEIYFNQTIDISKLSVSVRETLNGKSYVNSDPLGEDFIRAKGYALENINRNREAVPGQLNTVPRGAGVVFAPDRLFGYNAEVFISVNYDGKVLNRSRFKVRELPTFINGAIVDQFGQPLKDIVVSLPELDRTTKTNGDGGFSFGYQEAADKVIDSGNYQMLVNNDFANPSFGTINTQINIQRNRSNALPRYSLQELDTSVSFYSLKSSANNILAGGDLTIDLTDARALFTNSRTSGPVHAQFLPFEHMGVSTFQFAMPNWLFGLQPKGIKVEGDVELRFKIPKLRGSYDYIDPENYQYVVLLGYSAAGQVVEPIGVGKIENLSVVSVGKVHLSSLDYLGYAIVPPKLGSTLEDYSKRLISLQQLKAALQALKL